MKIKQRKMKKYLEGEVFVFIGQKAIVPGCHFQGKPMIITLSEFNEISKEIKKGKHKS